jgi:hypothetical protein
MIGQAVAANSIALICVNPTLSPQAINLRREHLHRAFE